MALSQSVLARLPLQHKTIDDLIAGLDEASLKRRLNPEKWSPFENIVHLAAYQVVFIHRIQLMLQEDEPLFQRYVADHDPGFRQSLEKPLQTILDDMARDRPVIVDLLLGMDESQLNRTGRHTAYGLIRIADWADFFLLHESHHLWTIFQLTYSLRALTDK